MTAIRRLEARLDAWTSFRGIARASRTLAAAQVRAFAQHLDRVDTYLRWCAGLAESFSRETPRDGGRALVAVGTDLGLCGRLNAYVAEATATVGDVDLQIVIGQRLADHAARNAIVVPAPSSFAAVETLAAQIEALLGEMAHLTVVVATSVRADGHPQVEVFDTASTPPQPLAGPPPAQLSPPQQTRPVALALLRHARVVAALTRGAASEAEARWRTMHRAHDAADRRVAEQERALRRLRREILTQEMLEARQGGRSRAGAQKQRAASG